MDSSISLFAIILTTVFILTIQCIYVTRTVLQLTSFFSSCLSKSYPIIAYLLQIVHYAEKIPLGVYFLLATQGKSIKTKSRSYMGKWRLTHSQSHTVDGSAYGGINLLLHLLGKSLLAGGRPSGEKGNLPYLGFLRFSQATSAKLAGQAG